jgi:hypothetical protein
LTVSGLFSSDGVGKNSLLTVKELSCQKVQNLAIMQKVLKKCNKIKFLQLNSQISSFSSSISIQLVFFLEMLKLCKFAGIFK